MKRILVGAPMATAQMEDTLLSKFLALPVFASDPLSSVAKYATEAAMLVLVAVSTGARSTSSCRSRSRSPRCC